MQLPVDQFGASPPEHSPDKSLDQAMLRAYPIERLVDYGCLLEDALKLRRRVEDGYGWSSVALHLANEHELRAERTKNLGSENPTIRFFLASAAGYRVAQAGLEHEPAQRLRIYERQAQSFTAAMNQTSSMYGSELIEISHKGVEHRAWLFRSNSFQDAGPVVVVWGGADGWCEAFHTSVPFYLERNISVCLLELPGQGLARLQRGSFLDVSYSNFVSKVLDVLTRKGSAADKFGIVGHSLGGSLAVAAAGADGRIRACCSKGGPPQLKSLIKYPRVIQRFGRMLGDDMTEAEVFEFCDQVDVEAAVTSMRANLLCLQGGQDPLVSDKEAEHLIHLRGKAAARLGYWAEGTHCIYNHALERNVLIADWFASELC